jgi:hypothetical protein
VDRDIGEPGEHRCQIVAHADSQPPAALYDRKNRRDLRSRHWAADVQPILATKSYQTQNLAENSMNSTKYFAGSTSNWELCS